MKVNDMQHCSSRGLVVLCLGLLLPWSGGRAGAGESSGSLPLTVHHPSRVEGVFPVTGGVPLPRGAAPLGTALTLRDGAGRAVPLQAEVLAQWPDESARWLLLDFQAAPGAAGEAPYRLHWGGEGEGVEMPQDTVSVAVSPDGRIDLGGRVAVALTLTRGDGTVCEARIEDALTLEAEGPLRRAHVAQGAFYTPEGDRVFQFRWRVSTYAGSSFVRVEPMILVDAAEGVMQRIGDLRLTVQPRDAPARGVFGGEPGWAGEITSATRLYQRDDRFYAIEQEGASKTVLATGEKAPGWAAAQPADGPGTAVALRDFWQQWPKDIALSNEGLALGLFPRFSAGDFSHMEPWYKYQYLFDDGAYRVRTGQARRWEVWIDLEGDGAALSAVAHAPLVVSASPDAAISTGVWGAIAPAGAPGLAAYDAWAENLFDAYQREIALQRDYGAMNWGDWFGERQVNWGNLEYDTAQQMLLQFARTGEPKYRYAADAAARHSAEVDTVHHVNDALIALFGAHDSFPARPGLVHQHTVGHVSGFYPVHVIRALFVERKIGNSPTPYLCLDPYNLGHVWTRGMTQAYFLTGDPFLRETVERIAGNLAQLVEDGQYAMMGHSHCGRTTGWPLIALAAAHEISRERRYLEAMKTLADRALRAQDPVCGGWLYDMPDGHCNCTTRKHVGMATFITAILINGLAEYYRVSEDARIPEAIGNAISYLIHDTWQETWSDWRATPCPARGPSRQPGVVMMAHVHGATIANHAEALRVLGKAWRARFAWLSESPPSGPGQGKEFSAKMLGSPETAGLLAQEGLLTSVDETPAL